MWLWARALWVQGWSIEVVLSLLEPSTGWFGAVVQSFLSCHPWALLAVQFSLDQQ